jgi:hypothetical protein
MLSVSAVIPCEYKQITGAPPVAQLENLREIPAAY